MIEMEAGDAFVTVAPTDGGRIAQIQVGELALLKDDRSGGPMTWGSYPMAPWAGRVRHGRFEFDGRTHQLPRNLEPHAIHGTVFTAGCTDWAWGLERGDPVVDRITRNVLDRLTRG